MNHEKIPTPWTALNSKFSSFHPTFRMIKFIFSSQKAEWMYKLVSFAGIYIQYNKIFLGNSYLGGC